MQARLLTAPQVAERTQLSVATIRRMCARRELRAYRLAGQWRITEDDLSDWIASGTPPAENTPGNCAKMARADRGNWTASLRAIEGGAHESA